MEVDSPRLVLILKSLSHHVYPMARELAVRLSGRFQLVCLHASWDYRKEFGWKTPGLEEPWVIRMWESETARDLAKKVIADADAVAFMDVPPEMVEERLRKNRLTFLMTERPFLRGWWSLHHRRVRRILRSAWKYRHQSGYHLLAIGRHCAPDFLRVGMFRGRCHRFGYFSELPTDESVLTGSDAVVDESGEHPFTILWAGRMVRFKRLDRLVDAVRRCRAILRDTGELRPERPLRLRLIGGGKMLGTVRKWIRQSGIDDLTTLEPFQPPETIRRAMREASVYVFPSDAREGWGAVVGESMSLGLPVIASDTAGSAEWLVRNPPFLCRGDSSCAREMAATLVRYYREPERLRAIGQEMAEYIREMWSPHVAAERLLKLIDSLSDSLVLPPSDSSPSTIPEWTDGPCSPATFPDSR
ncbi:MAG: glycosyltransferase family 4 protein [Planctomycetia bacterium]|nr:glycosyltransferase family 4 protein [Planctomycetia bacterium]